MKKWYLFLSVYACLCLLAACGATGRGAPVPGGAPSNEEQVGGESTQPASVTTVCRVVSNDGSLLLAGADGDPNIYILNPKDATNLAAGTLVGVTYDGTIMETWPSQFSEVTEVHTVEGGFDDRCALYLQVLEDLWAGDEGLNGNLTYIGVDLSQTNLSDSEQAAVAWVFAGRHGGELVTGTWEELAEQGYIDRENLYWEDGVLFSITEKETEGVYSLTPVTFDAEKWRSGLGAYFFCDCTSVQSADGHWNGYSIGSEAIS
ncbi:hypothetical protein [Dysosmobacter sp.]|uniref:hypothetical protein n=1 Tax=Dysosmobacter sp. TaxID=2591382 RepID=UPI002A9D4B64|nr:hypothetical protein [Dysosmobacter sp.]MDY5612064.1 hypothetical protein [Dysosmobacter sp.]